MFKTDNEVLAPPTQNHLFLQQNFGAESMHQLTRQIKKLLIQFLQPNTKYS